MRGRAAVEAIVELYGPNQRSGGALRQLWRKLRLRGGETAPLQASMRRAVEHRALMAIAIGDLGARQHLAAGGRPARPRMDAVRAHPRRGTPLDEATARPSRSRGSGARLRTLHDQQISHGDLRAREDHRRRRHRAVRRIRQCRVRSHRRAAAVRHRAAAGDHDRALRRTEPRCGAAIGRLRQGRRADRVPTAHESGCAQTHPEADRRRRRGDVGRCATR